MNFVGWILFGLIIAQLVNLIDPPPRIQRFVKVFILGIGGAIAGGLGWSLVSHAGIGEFNFASLFMASVGSLVLLHMERSFV